MGALKSGLILSALLLISCSRTTTPNDKTTSEDKSYSQSVQLGIAEKTDGTFVDLDAVPQKSVVLVFASDTCSKCAEEAHYWSALFKNGVVQNVYFVHFLIGGNLNDAAEWKNLYQINWDVVVEGQDILYKRYCSSIRTPCFLIVNKENNKTIQTYNILRKENIEEITGPWQF